MQPTSHRPTEDRNPLTRVSCWARRRRSRRPCAEAPAHKFLESPILSSFVFLDTTGIQDRSDPKMLATRCAQDPLSGGPLRA